MDNLNASNPYVNGTSWKDVLPGITFGIVIVIINQLTLFIIIYYENVKEKYVVLLGSLCISDTLTGISLIMNQINVLYNNEFLGAACLLNPGYCVYVVFLFFPAFSSHLHLLTLSFDRWMAVQYALTYYTIMTSVRFRIIVASAWLFSIFMGISCFFMMCHSPLAFNILPLVILIIVFCINLVINIHLWRMARRHRIQIMQQQAPIHQQQPQLQQRPPIIEKATIVTIAYTACFVVCNFPTICVKIWQILSEGDEWSKATKVLYDVQTCTYIYSILTCFVYFALNKELRKIVRCLKCIKC